MQKIEFIIHFLRHLAMSLVLTGLMAIVLGTLIFVYPDLLGILVGLFLVGFGFVSFASAWKIWRYSKVRVEL